MRSKKLITAYFNCLVWNFNCSEKKVLLLHASFISYLLYVCAVVTPRRVNLVSKYNFGLCKLAMG